MARHVHFEVFSRRGAKGGWSICDVKYERDEALKYAQSLLEEGATGVKVVKETYDEDSGDYLALKIFEDGHNQMKTAPAQEDLPQAIPCFRPEDLYNYHARQVIAKLLGEYLARNKVTVTELMHRADLLEKFEATGTLLQHAIQKVAVAQAASSATPVQQIIKTLNELTTRAFHRVYRDARTGVFPEVAADGFGALAAKLASATDGQYVLNGAIARHLRDCKGWDEKVARLIALMPQSPEDSPGGALLAKSIDTIIAELLNGAAALQDLIGSKETQGEALTALVLLFLGREPEGGRDGLISLTKHFANDTLPESRTAIANRITAEFKSFKRFCPASLIDEFKTLRQIANLVVQGVGKYLSHEDLVSAFTLRSKRLITHETLSDHLASATNPEEKLERLLFVEDNIIGVENKRQLAGFILPVVVSAGFEGHFLSPKTPVLHRLQRLAALSAHVRRSNFQEHEKEEIAGHLDRIACEAEARGKLLETIHARHISHVERALTVLKLFEAGTFTEPNLGGRARAMIVANLSKPGFLTGYLALAAKAGEPSPQASETVAELMAKLERIGLTEDNGLKSIAA